MNWTAYQQAFEWDGSWRDIYVLGTAMSDWRKLLTFLKSSNYPLAYLIDGKEAPLPEYIEYIFEQRWENSILLSVNIQGIILNCHFFWEKEIEFDVDPREVDEVEKAEALFEFMKQVGQLLKKDVILTPENMQEIILFRFNSETNELLEVASSNKQD